MFLRERLNAASLNFIILKDISSQPYALLGISDLMILRIFSSEMAKSVMEVVVSGKSHGISFPVSMVMHWSIK